MYGQLCRTISFVYLWQPARPGIMIVTFLWRLKSVKTIPDYEVRAAWSRFLQSLELVRSEDQVSYRLNKYVPIVKFMFVDF